MFYVPSESGEKVTLGISALLSMTVFLMTIRESLPPTEKTPLISKGVSDKLITDDQRIKFDNFSNVLWRFHLLGVICQCDGCGHFERPFSGAPRCGGS